MDLREEYKEETACNAISRVEHLSLSTLNYIAWLENKITQNKKEEIYHSLNCHECNLESKYVLAKDGCSEDWSVVKLIEINKEKANYPFFCSSQKTSGHFQFVKKITNIKKITPQEAVDLLASCGHFVEIV